MGQISGSGVQKELMAEHPVHNANDTNISTYLIANIKLRRDGTWNLANKHHEIENLRGEAEWAFKLHGVWKPNSKSHLSAAWCLLLTPRLQKIEWVFKILSEFTNFESNTTIFPNATDYQIVKFGFNSEILKHLFGRRVVLTTIALLLINFSCSSLWSKDDIRDLWQFHKTIPLQLNTPGKAFLFNCLVLEWKTWKWMSFFGVEWKLNLKKWKVGGDSFSHLDWRYK